MAAVFWRSLAKGLCKYVTPGTRGVEVVGFPDWLLEIVSDSSVFKDKQQLRHAYHEALSLHVGIESPQGIARVPSQPGVRVTGGNGLQHPARGGVADRFEYVNHAMVAECFARR